MSAQVFDMLQKIYHLLKIKFNFYLKTEFISSK